MEVSGDRTVVTPVERNGLIQWNKALKSADRESGPRYAVEQSLEKRQSERHLGGNFPAGSRLLRQVPGCGESDGDIVGARKVVVDVKRRLAR
jgi:hypothetical protein